MNVKYALAGMMVMISVHAHASDPMIKIQDMLDDLGDVSQIPRNNGKTFKCSLGGTKKVTVTFSEKTTIYSAYYDNCREKDRVRDVIYEIETSGSDVVRDEEKPTKNEELFNAAVLNDLDKVKTQLGNKALVNMPHSMPMDGGGAVDGWTPLMAAASNGNLEMVKLLVKKGAGINLLNAESKSALWYATTTGNPELVGFLLKSGARVNSADLSGMTPLMVAAVNGDVEVVKLLIKHKAKLDMKHKDGDSALMYAIANGKTDVAGMLIKAGANVNVSNKYGATALIICAMENNVEVARQLIQRKANVHAKTDFGKTALDIATAKGNANIVKLISESH